MFGLEFGVLVLCVVAVAFVYAISQLVWTIAKMIIAAIVTVLFRFVFAVAGLAVGACVLYTIISLIS